MPALIEELSFITTLFNRFILRDLLKNRLRFIITVLGIALGVSVLLAINLANSTVNSQFHQTVDRISGKANLEIRPATVPYIEENILKQIEWIEMNGGKYSPLIEKYVALPNNQEEIIQFIGIDMLSDPDFKSVTTESSDSTDTNIFEPNTVFIGSKFANKHHLLPGQTFSILVNDSVKQLKVAKILCAKGIGGSYSGNLIVADLSVAQEVLELSGKITAIELIVPPSSLPETREKLISELPTTLSIERPSQRSEQIEKITQSFEYNLLALSFVALMVGMFLIYNTMSITVLRRKQEIGILRALGVKRQHILTIFGLEVLLLGTLGSALGSVAGLFLSSSALQIISKTIQYFYYQEPIDLVNVNPAVLAITFLGGVAITFLSSLPPLLEATTIAPAEAVRRGSQTTRLFHASKNFLLLASLLFFLAYCASVQPAINHFPIFGYAAALLSILACAFCLPSVLQTALPWSARLMTHLKLTEGKLAALSLFGTLDRTVVAVASLMLGIAMMVSLATMIGSFRNTVNTWMEQTLKADLWVQSQARAQGSADSRLSNFVLEVIRHTPGVEAVDSFVETPIVFRGEQSNLAAADFSIIKDYGHLRFISGETCKSLFSRLHKDSALISETFAIRKNIKEGDIIVVNTPSGTIKLKIAGVYYDYSSDLGYILIDRQLFSQTFHNSDISSCAVYLKPTAKTDAVRSSILKALSGKSLISIRSTGELRLEAIKIFDRTFSITYALHTIAIIVAILSVMNALFALSIESKREFGVLRYIGATEKQIRKLILYEAAFLGIFGNIGGLFLGAILSVLLIYVINRQSFGWTIEVSVPYVFLIESSILIFLTAILSGLIPARFAAKTIAPSVVRDE